jgi:MFS family permease
VFTVAIAAVMALMTAFSTADWTEIGIIGAIAVIAVAGFVVQERRSPEPMISLDLWGRRPVAAVNAASLFAGMVMIGLTTFLPVFVQGVMGRPPLTAGFALSAMVLGWPIGATLSPRLWSRFGLRNVLRAGSALIPIGALAFVFLRADTSPAVAGIGSALVGFGMGLSSSASIVLIQEIVAWSERGSVTAAYMFARTLGSAFGATVFGAVLNFGLSHAGLGVVSSDQLRRLLDGGAAATDSVLRGALDGSLRVTFVSMFVVALLVAAAAALVPKVKFAVRRAPAE